MSVVNEESNQKEGIEYSFEFSKLGNYDNTRVELKASIPFRRLHLIFLFPALILRQYWSTALYSNMNDKNTPGMLKDHLSTEREHTDQIEHLSEYVNLFDDFPHIRSKKSKYNGRKLTLSERLIGRLNINW